MREKDVDRFEFFTLFLRELLKKCLPFQLSIETWFTHGWGMEFFFNNSQKSITCQQAKRKKVFIITGREYRYMYLICTKLISFQTLHQQHGNGTKTIQ